MRRGDQVDGKLRILLLDQCPLTAHLLWNILVLVDRCPTRALCLDEDNCTWVVLSYAHLHSYVSRRDKCAKLRCVGPYIGHSS
jgi:hypothetical protein